MARSRDQVTCPDRRSPAAVGDLWSGKVAGPDTRPQREASRFLLSFPVLAAIRTGADFAQDWTEVVRRAISPYSRCLGHMTGPSCKEF